MVRLLNCPDLQVQHPITCFPHQPGPFQLLWSKVTPWQCNVCFPVWHRSGVNQHARQLEVGYIFLILDDPVSWQTESVSDPHLSWWDSSVGWVVEHMLHLFLFAFHNVVDLPQLIALLVLAYLLICNRSSFCFTPFLPPPWQQPPCFLLFGTFGFGVLVSPLVASSMLPQWRVLNRSLPVGLLSSTFRDRTEDN